MISDNDRMRLHDLEGECLDTARTYGNLSIKSVSNDDEESEWRYAGKSEAYREVAATFGRIAREMEYAYAALLRLAKGSGHSARCASVRTISPLSYTPVGPCDCIQRDLTAMASGIKQPSTNEQP